MSSSISYSRRCQAQQTLAVNRLGAGWIDDSATFVHKFGASALELTSPQSNDTEILLIVDEDEPGAFITAETRVDMGYDQGLQKEGVALHLVDQRLGSCGTPIAGGCLSLSRYQGQAVGQPYSSDHVIGVGESIGLAGITLSVDEGSRPGTFRVLVEGELDLDRLN